MSPATIEAGAALMFVRGLVCKAVREGSPAEEIKALLLAEAQCVADLASCQKEDGGES